MANIKVKTYSDTYLYNVSKGYEENIFKFLMEAQEVDKNSESFKDIKYEVKRRQITTVLGKVLELPSVVLLINDKPLPKSFKVFCAKDIKAQSANAPKKVYIDCSDLITYKNGEYSIKGNVDVFISYLMSAMVYVIYYSDPKHFESRSLLIDKGTKCFALLFTGIIDYLQKISTIPGARNKVLYLSSVYFMVNIMNKELDEKVKSMAAKIADITDREVNLIHIGLGIDAFKNISTFVAELAKLLHLEGKLTLELFIEKWLYLYGTGTIFALELFPSFSSMMTDAYVGAYINNQKTIEKITQNGMVDYTNELMRVGSNLIK